MYIEFLNESLLWYWYYSGGVIAGLALTSILAALVFAQTSWKAKGILIKTILAASFLSVAPLGLARLGFSMAISNADLVGLLSIGGTAVTLAVSAVYFIGKGINKTGEPKVVMQPAAVAGVTHVETVAQRNSQLEHILVQPKYEAEVKMDKTENDIKVDVEQQIKFPVPIVQPVDDDMTDLGYQKSSRIGWLTINNGDNAGDIFYLAEGSNTVGRNSSNQISVNDVYMSGEQCDIRVYDSKITLFDLGSSSGTKINGRNFGGKIINLGSTVTVGDTKLKVLKVDSPEHFNSITNVENTVVETEGKKAVVLVAVSGPDAGNSYLLQEGINKIGRSSDSNIRLTDKSVSRKHAVVKCQDGEFTLFDVGSSTTTEVDGMKVGGMDLRGNEEINAGHTRFTFTAAA